MNGRVTPISDAKFLDRNGKDLPCGCRLATRQIGGERRFLIRPCSLDCTYYRYALEGSIERGNELRIGLDLP